MEWLLTITGYTRSLQQILTGLYIGELSLLGIFVLRKATGPSIMMAVLVIITIGYNILTNRYLNPLEDRFPDELLAGQNEEEEALLAAEEGDAVGQAHDESRVQQVGRNLHVPQTILDPIASFFEPHIYASHKTMKAFLGTSEADPPEYSEEDIRTAYLNPSLTSKAPQIWLPFDEAGLSKKEIEENSAAGIASTDQGAWLDEKGRVKFDNYNLRSTPLWSEKALY
jgi:hypothetical protein